MWVKPSPPGAHVRDPRTKLVIPAEGFAADPTDLSIARLVRDGDLVVVPDAKPAAKAKG